MLRLFFEKLDIRMTTCLQIFVFFCLLPCLPAGFLYYYISYWVISLLLYSFKNPTYSEIENKVAVCLLLQKSLFILFGETEGNFLTTLVNNSENF
jgi:hypothetical protein